MLHLHNMQQIYFQLKWRPLTTWPPTGPPDAPLISQAKFDHHYADRALR